MSCRRRVHQVFRLSLKDGRPSQTLYSGRNQRRPLRENTHLFQQYIVSIYIGYQVASRGITLSQSNLAAL
jgi:hypothetical protein